MNTPKTIEAQLFDIVMDHLDRGDLPPASTLMLVHHTCRHFAPTTRTAAEWLNDKDAVPDLAVRIEAAISRRALADHLDRYRPEGQLTADDFEQLALDELERFAERTLNTWCAIMRTIQAEEPDQKVSTLDLVAVGLLEPTV